MLYETFDIFIFLLIHCNNYCVSDLTASLILEVCCAGGIDHTCFNIFSCGYLSDIFPLFSFIVMLQSSQVLHFYCCLAQQECASNQQNHGHPLPSVPVESISSGTLSQVSNNNINVPYFVQ